MINKIKKHYSESFEKHGPTSKGVDWKNENQSIVRHNTFLNLITKSNVKNFSLLDVGCGYGSFYDYLISNQYSNIKYLGIDLVKEMIEHAKKKYNKDLFIVENLLTFETKEQYDFVIANGLFTQKFNFTQNQMLRFFTECILKLNKISRRGFLFNILSENIDFKNPKNFYLNKREVNNILNRQYYTNIENISKNELFETFYMIHK